MKNNTFNQIVNANLASIDPGFGQFALAKASADLFKKGHQQVTQGLHKQASHLNNQRACVPHGAQALFSCSAQAPPRIQPPPATAHTAPHITTQQLVFHVKLCR